MQVGWVKIGDFRQVTGYISTRSSAIAEWPRDASCQLKSCQLPLISAETTYTTSPDQIDGIKLEVLLEAMCNIHVHSTMTRPSRFHCLRCVINEPTTDDLWISPVYRRLAVAKFSKSTPLTTPLSGKIFRRQGGTCYGKSMYHEVQWGSVTGQYDVAVHLAVNDNEFVFVAYHDNCRVTLLSPRLEYVRQVVSGGQLKGYPSCLYLDTRQRLLYVAVSKSEKGKWRGHDEGEWRRKGKVICFSV